MKSMKKCTVTKEKISKRIKRCSSAGMFYTSSAGAVTSLILITTLSFLTSAFLNPTGLTGTNQAHATTSTINISVVDSVSLSILPTSTSGTFATSDTSTNNISVKTTNGTGYTLGIKASTEGSNALSYTDTTTSTTYTIPSHTVSAGISETTYSTDSTYNNTWGYRPSKLNSTANSNYLPGPTSASTAITLDKTTSANPTSSNNYNLAIGARVNDSTAPGAYSNVFVLTVTANPIPYTITYNKNTTDTVTNMPANVSSQTYDETVNISGLIPARDGFNFKGWCTVQVADGGTCTGTTYNPDGGGTALTWTLDQTQPSNSLTLYAMWEQASKFLYDMVAKQSKGTQTLAELRTAIDTSNSGVYEYNSSVFGTASDAANTSKIYYYRGILDNTVGTYGSDGDNAAWPNTVVLSSASSKSGLTTNDTCWRIVRTTGSGGVKMIYQGKWTGSTCANSGSKTNAVGAAYVHRRSSDTSCSSSNNYCDTAGRIIYVGYSISTTSSLQTSTTDTVNSTLFATGTKKSNLRTKLESWYSNNMTDWTSKLETNAGWCNDRTTHSYTNGNYVKTTSNIPYSTSTLVYFGAYIRNATTNSSPSLNCSNEVDILTTSNGMAYPSAPLTADEATFAGSSGYSQSSPIYPYHANSFLRSGVTFWLLSPSIRSGGGAGQIRNFYMLSYGNSYDTTVSDGAGVRPSISLKPGSMAVSGSGTAADPWIVNP